MALVRRGRLSDARPYPSLVCWPCARDALIAMGVEHPAPDDDAETYRLACEVCGQETTVADPVDFCNPRFAGRGEPWERWPGDVE